MTSDISVSSRYGGKRLSSSRPNSTAVHGASEHCVVTVAIFDRRKKKMDKTKLSTHFIVFLGDRAYGTGIRDGDRERRYRHLANDFDKFGFP